MMTSMLGLILIGGSAASADEMSARPDSNGSYGILDEILADLNRAPKTETESAES